MTDTATTDADVTLRAGNAELTLEPHRGCRIASLKVGGTELLRQGNRYGAFVMVPWCGRTDQGRFRSGGELYQLPLDTGPHAIHGTVRDGAWRTLRQDDRSAAFTYELSDPWPWEGLVTQIVELDEAGEALTLTLGVEAADSSFPAQAGWHPWFLRDLDGRGGDVRIDFDPQWQEERGVDHLPTGTRIAPRPGPWDDCFGMPQGVDVTLTWPGKLELKVASRAEWVVVYDEQPEAVCVEPQTGPPNGLNSHPHLVTPIQPLEVSTTWSWRALS
ncbi:aldose epimerase family protein [Streptomyces winkii]|uniref:aldose epimerase family protein n=1 Tax=Streptomyces winkii TaxID=3051178 RepID=UPI0028D58113|nr:aldose 1-epimerase [Streptomyces sp. DSM 40971]